MSRKKKKESGAAKADPPEAADKAVEENEVVEVPSLLHEPYWSVISFRGCERSNLTYKEAEKFISALSEEEKPGLCIVTNAAAERMSTE